MKLPAMQMGKIVFLNVIFQIKRNIILDVKCF